MFIINKLNFKCEDCMKQFLYAAKKIEVNIEGEAAPITTTFETHVCPYCHSLNFSEAQAEQIQQPKMVDLVECEVPHVKEYLERGYVVIDRYAKSIRLALYKNEDEQK